jgi:large subunit ribosomal protein L2
VALKILKPVTPSSRGTVLVAKKKDTTRSTPTRSLTRRLKKSSGRSHGKISTHHKGGGNAKRYRIIDFKRGIRDLAGVITSIEYDPNRNVYISLVVYENGQKTYILTPQGVNVGDKVSAGDNASADIGNAMPLNKIPVGTQVHNIEINPGSGGVMVRAAGMSATLMGFDEDNRAQIKLPSKEVRLVNSACYATIGTLSNTDNKNTKKGKAGRNRWLGIRPTVRGMVKPPSDHPHGGGEAKGVIGHVVKDRWGNIRGKNTRRKKNRFSQLRLVNRKGQKIVTKKK